MIIPGSGIGPRILKTRKFPLIPSRCAFALSMLASGISLQASNAAGTPPPPPPATQATGTADKNANSGSGNSGTSIITQRTYGHSSTLELDGAVICAVVGTSVAASVERYFASNSLQYVASHSESHSAAVSLYEARGCDALAVAANTAAKVTASFSDLDSL